MAKLLNSVVVVFSIITSYLLVSCEERKINHHIDLYHWKTDYTIAQNERVLLQQLNSERLYLRFFDIAFDQEEQKALPIATLQIKPSDSLPKVKIVPVVYITNEVFRKIKDSISIQQLAKATIDKISRLKDKYLKSNRFISEIQMDCDWTESTKIAYFQFLRELKKQITFVQLGKETQIDSALQISATVRLHQIKFRERTGVPPVNKAVIMCYNVGELRDPNEKNSILNLEKTTPYLKRLNEYPLPFDIALPFYGWGALYRNGAFAGILDDKQLFKKFDRTDEEGIFIASSEMYINKTFVYKNDLLRWETVKPDDLQALNQSIRNSTKRNYSLILYHINSTELKNQDIDALLDALY